MDDASEGLKLRTHAQKDEGPISRPRRPTEVTFFQPGTRAMQPKLYGNSLGTYKDITIY